MNFNKSNGSMPAMLLIDTAGSQGGVFSTTHHGICSSGTRGIDGAVVLRAENIDWR